MGKNIKKISELKEQMKELKENFDADYSKLELKVQKLEKGNYDIGDIIEYENFEWYVIEINENKIKLMLKNVLEQMTYSDNNSNDWKESNVRKYLINWANVNLAVEALDKMKTNYDEDKYSYDFIRIPTIREIEALPIAVRESNDYYWTMTSSYSVSEDCSYASVFGVFNDGNLGWYSVDNAVGVRPVIEVSNKILELKENN